MVSKDLCVYLESLSSSIIEVHPIKYIKIIRIARIADMVSKRLQLQERIGSDIAEVMQKITGSEDVAVLIEGSHSCMTARGIKKPASKTYTTTLRGIFKTEQTLLNSIYRGEYESISIN